MDEVRSLNGTPSHIWGADTLLAAFEGKLYSHINLMLTSAFSKHYSVDI